MWIFYQKDGSDEYKENYVIDDYNCFCVSRNIGVGIMAFCQSNVTADTILIEAVTYATGNWGLKY